MQSPVMNSWHEGHSSPGSEKGTSRMRERMPCSMQANSGRQYLRLVNKIHMNTGLQQRARHARDPLAGNQVFLISYLDILGNSHL